MESKFFVYVIQSAEGLIYKGVTNNLESRLFEHNSNLGGWTKNKGPFKLVYFEEYSTRTEALKRENFFKSGQGREFLKSLIVAGSNSAR